MELVLSSEMKCPKSRFCLVIIIGWSELEEATVNEVVVSIRWEHAIQTGLMNSFFSGSVEIFLRHKMSQPPRKNWPVHLYLTDRSLQSHMTTSCSTVQMSNYQINYKIISLLCQSNYSTGTPDQDNFHWFITFSTTSNKAESNKVLASKATGAVSGGDPVGVLGSWPPHFLAVWGSKCARTVHF